MVTLLSKIFIKNREQTENPEVRQEYGMLCGAVGIFLNLLLFAGKAIAGAVSGSIAVTADAFNNLSDAGSSIITLVGFKMSGQKPDSEHPFGHGRIEYIAGFLVSVIILIMAFELFKSSVDKILHPEPVEAGMLVILILIFSILVKVYMFAYNRSVAARIESETMGAAAKDSLSDTIATFVVLATTLLARFTGIQVDGFCGIVVAAFVCMTGISAAKDTISPLLGQPPTPEFVNRVEEIIMEYKDQGILGIHDLVVHNYGPGRVMLSVHAEVPSTGNLLELHDLIDRIEHRLTKELSCSAVIHMDPVCLNDEQTNELKEKVEKIIEGMEGKVSFHDFRIVKGPTHTNLIFDILLPYEYSMTDEQVVAYLKEKIAEIDPTYQAVIDVDKAYV